MKTIVRPKIGASAQDRLIDDRGTAMLEFAVVLQLIVFLLLMTLEFGMAIDRYLTLTRISYEGARYATRIAGLEESSTPFIGAQLVNSNAPAPMQARLYKRISRLLAINNIKPGLTTVQTQLVKANPGSPANVVEVTIQFNHQTILDLAAFGLFNNIPLSVSSKAPYLYPLSS